MFNLFKKKQGINVSDKITMDEAAKHAALFTAWQANKNLVIIFWFEDSLQAATDYFSRQTTETGMLLMARETASPQLTGKQVVFGEHYPLRDKETMLYEKLNLSAVVIYSSLKDPLLHRFGGDRIIGLMETLGMAKDEVIEHKMISNSISNAQEKIKKKINYEQSTRSAADWFKINLGA
jgi:hypothetical protein